MAWFKRTTPGIIPQEKKELPDGLWLKCEKCNEIIYRKELERNLHICMKCGFHFRMKSKMYISLLLDNGEFEEFNAHIQSVDVLKFKAQRKYADQLKSTMKTSGLNEAVITGFGKMNGHPVVFCVMDFSFIGGSMGSVVGEKIARATRVAIEKKMPLIIVSASGGARMMEGALSLMQMAKTSAYLAMLSDHGLPFISIVTNPTTGGVTASYAMLGDVIIAEPGALIGFAGPRVIKQTIGQDLPEGFQTSEFLLEHGFIDAIFTRHEMKEKITRLLEFFGSGNEDVHENETAEDSADQ
ncbi:MAG: acetyl-CoA carboxylase, carboxyltransferase subunit beta [candidate division KSB1 bacterium]|nr:acetyl-CoA carboxylase, carboxyltransferase subunit beta [candidate division KSB1 bacterium]MDZ7319362.1 acetyl-CoA carboxylase, carboxyltransferase subunit beta [candidate division KSB1 bacterium]MDZ7340214.1 acetyl-CoA carboxylase, carboxyltransferase subunit beta [candidate division KSB1 bacterium]